LFCTQKVRGVAENKCGIHPAFPFTAGEEVSKQFFYQLLWWKCI